jgi:UPF0042 nucleotide-binding protein
MTGARTPRLILITGLSGSGKSSVAKCFEDLDYYTVDNLPLSLLRQFLADPREHVGDQDRIAVVTDVRATGFADELPRILGEIDSEKADLTVLFLEASTETLLRRFSETRRPHPLSGGKRVVDGIDTEREILAEVRGLADMVFDTSEWTIHEIRSEVYRRFSTEGEGPPGLSLTIVSFGFKHGIPYGSDTVFDVRFVPNPHFVPGLREQTGQDLEVVSYLENQVEYRELVTRLEALCLYLLPQYQKENRSHFSIAVGCTGGRHRSVAVAESLGRRLADGGWSAHLVHRDIER